MSDVGALHDAAGRGDVNAIQQIIESGVDVNAAAAGDGETALHAAAVSGQVVAIRALVKAGANVNASDAQGCTPLLFALAFGGKDAIIELLQSGADPYVEDAVGRNAFDRAAARGFQGEWGKLYEYYDHYYNPIS